LQRFIAEDPVGFRGGDINLYAYVRNAPLRLLDPLGLDPAGAHDRCSYGFWQHFGESGWMRVYATREGLIGQTTASGHLMQADDIFVALPSSTALSRLVQVEYESASILAPVMDVGPYSIDDPYWIGENRPKAESGQRTKSLQAKYGPPKNRAGIDLSDQAFRELGMTNNDYVWWQFSSPDQFGGRKDKGACQ
jgi:uncharacterized protein RhaS with RHS repeats